ncbi:stage VI sporulation protein D [Lentibacillus sediminis]|uniref:stage VI sporulation protein D n=1 Tax=Lentibacillus sediminis TaxID=1940529 RepID=UPI000C1BAC7D|nr:stage VI sporulation protein D [Lentibacillus sediminis]
MSAEQSVFRFELNESLYFEKGQEVGEIRGISLDPEIGIQPFNDYISIRGVIELRGEYQKLPSEEEESPSGEFEDFHARRYVESVVDQEAGYAEFAHRFPVEISVPAYRVSDIENVTVNIESFDYEIPAENHLKLYSTIEINGIDNSAAETPVEPEDYGQEEEAFARNEADTFEFDWKEEQEPAPPELAETPAPPDIPAISMEPEEEEAQKDRWKYKQTQSLKEFFDDSSSSSQEEESSSSDEEEAILETDESSSYEESSESRDEAQAEDVSYLADMFRSSEEDSYSKMRLCIVQSKDTIDTIAERYQVPALQLIKQNQLEEDYDVTEGQLLRIPAKNS